MSGVKVDSPQKAIPRWEPPQRDRNPLFKTPSSGPPPAKSPTKETQFIMEGID